MSMSTRCPAPSPSAFPCSTSSCGPWTSWQQPRPWPPSTFAPVNRAIVLAAATHNPCSTEAACAIRSTIVPWAPWLCDEVCQVLSTPNFLFTGVLAAHNKTPPLHRVDTAFSNQQKYSTVITAPQQHSGATHHPSTTCVPQLEAEGGLAVVAAVVAVVSPAAGALGVDVVTLTKGRQPR